MIPGSHAFDYLHSKLIFYEQCLKFKSNQDVPVHTTHISTVSFGNYHSLGDSH